MELPRRARGDELLKPGELTDLRGRLRRLAGGHDIATVIACAFDHRTRMLPFIFADMRMAPAGVRAVGSAMADVGFEKTRIVLQQWNRRFAPSRMRLDGRVPDVFMVSSMQIHTSECRRLIRDAWRIDPAHRPLIIAGGPKVFYEPWDVFSADPNDPASADVAVTGEEFVLLSLLEVLLTERAANEPLRQTFARARDAGLLDDLPGLVYARTGSAGHAEHLVDTGVQRLVGDLDELPDPVLGYRLLEPPSRRAELGAQALPPGRIHHYSPISALVMTFGCKFSCPYCPIPAYNQRQYRAKSGERITEEMTRLNAEYGLHWFFGADDNFFNDPARAIGIAEKLEAQRQGPAKTKLRWATEATVHDTLRMADHLPLMRRAGMRGLWLGVEDMSGALVRKGQNVDQTTEAFNTLRRRGIMPMPMMMHHDSQPLVTRGKADGLLNQVHMLREAGAVSMQVLMITPATGSKLYESTFNSGMAYASAAGRAVELHMFDGNYVVASRADNPWRKQLNILAAYVLFYNPLRLLVSIVRPKSGLYLADAMYQGLGMWGLMHTVRRTLDWAVRLWLGPIARRSAAPISLIPMRAASGGQADHALPDTPLAPPGARATPDRPTPRQSAADALEAAGDKR